MIAFDANVVRGAFSAHYRGSFAELTVIGGPSGSGKSTLLDLIAGLIPAEGSCAIDGVPLHLLPPHQRGIGYAFQDDRLFPHLTVEKNLLFSGKHERFARAVESLELQPLLDRRPKALSGGERRRVGIARAIVAAERLLLLDEPLAPLDAALRERAASLIVETAAELPTIVVSHEALPGAHVEITALVSVR